MPRSRSCLSDIIPPGAAHNDAEAVAEAVPRPNLRVVQEKTQDQLDLQALHRVRGRLVSRRTATIN